MDDAGWGTAFSVIGIIGLAALLARILLDSMARHRQRKDE